MGKPGMARQVGWRGDVGSEPPMAGSDAAELDTSGRLMPGDETRQAVAPDTLPG